MMIMNLMMIMRRSMMMIMSRLMIMTYPWTASAMIAYRVTFSTLPDSHLVANIIKLVMAIMKRVRQLSLVVQAELNAQPRDTLRGSQGLGGQSQIVPSVPCRL